MSYPTEQPVTDLGVAQPSPRWTEQADTPAAGHVRTVVEELKAKSKVGHVTVRYVPIGDLLTIARGRWAAIKAQKARKAANETTANGRAATVGTPSSIHEA